MRLVLPPGFLNILLKQGNTRTHYLPAIIHFTLYPEIVEIPELLLLNIQNINAGRRTILEAFLSQISGKYEREFLRNAARNAYILNESDKTL